MSVWFITGSSRGLGLEIARAALENGHQVVATARDKAAVTRALGSSERLLAVSLDVTDAGRAATAVEEATAAFGRIDVLVNNSGFGLLGAVEEISDAEAREVFDVNVFGLLGVTRAVLPGMRARRSGRIINIGSIGGFVTIPSSGIYGATKFAVEGITEALSAELAGTGVTATVVEPGAFRTEFLAPSSIRFVDPSIDDYADTAHAMRGRLEAANGQQPGDPRKAAAAILEVAGTPNPPLRIQLGADSVARVEAKLKLVAEELAEWRELSESTAFTE
ncbi:oxidoreductase [Pseudonocardia sp. Cha107L01]|uniref:oxidoreductase n=1 Tax=Pseudonocardia sp. Cha107L01 TaxID=3457576 RepID=UPI00403E9466